LTTTSEALLELRRPETIRERCETILRAGVAGELEHFSIHLDRLPDVAREVAAVTLANYPDRRIPLHGRYRHFQAGGIDRLRLLEQRLQGLSEEEKLLSRVELAIVSVRILDGMLSILPSARVGHVGIYRDPRTLGAVEYYFKMPPHMNRREAIVVDPMLATGHSAIAAVDRVKETSPLSIKFVCLLASRVGIETFHEYHPDVPIYTAAVDERLNDKGYILPGLGDAGDRLFGTR